jgi:hypothetical protein
MAVMSDSTSDEYRANDNRAGGGQYAATTLAWTELLAKYRSFDLGPWGTRSEPRRTGYEYNWARSGAIANTLVGTGQHTGTAAQVRSGLIDVVYLQIGNNDFAYYADGAAIYSGSISGTTLTNKINSVASNITTALDTVLAANTTVKVVLGTIPDPGQTVHWRTQYPDTTKRKRVTDAIVSTNTKIKALASTRSRVVIFDQDVFAQSLLGRVNASGNLVISGQSISFTSNGDEPHHATLGDNIHGGTVLEGLFANGVIERINVALGTSVQAFSDTELLTNASILKAPSPSPTLRPTPTPVPQTCAEDINLSGKVDTSDYLILVANFLQSPLSNPRADINRNGAVNTTDFNLLVLKFLQTCP